MTQEEHFPKVIPRVCAKVPPGQFVKAAIEEITTVVPIPMLQDEVEHVAQQHLVEHVVNVPAPTTQNGIAHHTIVQSAVPIIAQASTQLEVPAAAKQEEMVHAPGSDGAELSPYALFCMVRDNAMTQQQVRDLCTSRRTPASLCYEAFKFAVDYESEDDG